jgi:extracellular elastinolytic metalloproteinase
MAARRGNIGRRKAPSFRACPAVGRLEDRSLPAALNYTPPSVFLPGPGGSGVAGPHIAAQQPLDSALSFLGGHAAELGLAPGDLNGTIVTSQYTDTDTGISHVYLRQQVNGLPVINAGFSVGIAANGAVISAGGGFVTNLQATLGHTGTPWPALTARQAVVAAAASLGLQGDPEYLSAFVGPVTSPSTSYTLSAKSVSLGDIPVMLVYVPTPDGRAVEAWDLNIQTPDTLHWYDMTIDARTGAVLTQVDWVDNDAYNVVPPPNESPQDGGFTVVTNPADPLASPFGWQDTNGVAGPEFTTTQGNNVDAHLDVNADNVADPSPGRPNGGAALDFSNLVLNPTQSPSTLGNQMIAQENLFYMNNWLHDVHYQYGFTEAAGNFQVNNYGRGGAANDPVQADAQDGSGTNNANFATPVDGSSGRMQMYLWTSTSPQRDGDLDDGVMMHEYGHGVSNRLTGGPANSNALNNTQSGGMGEGWSDFYALMFTQRPTDQQNDGFGIGTYVIGQAPTGGGIRRFKYSFNMTTDPLTWDAYGTSGTTSYGVTRQTEVHDTGEIWATTLWDMNWLLINKYGYDPDVFTGWSASPGPAHAGNKLALRLVMDAMKLQPANPSFTQARDSIIAADQALDGGADLYEIWSAFARRGLGQGSSTPSSTSTATPTLSTTLPMLVQSVGPATGAVVSSHPASYTLNVTAAVDPASLQASDLTVNGQAATGLSYTAGSTSATFTFATDPVTATGPQTIQIASGAFNRASDASAVSPFSSTFYYDPTPLTVTSVTPASGATVAPPLTTIDVNLNQAIDPSKVQNSDLSISRGTVTGFTLLNGNTTVRFTVANLTTEQTLTVYVAAGAFLDPQGNPNAKFDDGTVTIDIGTTAFPTPLQSVSPGGSLVYTGTSARGNIGTPTDTDSYTLTLDAGQTLNVSVLPDTTLRPLLTVTGPGTNVSTNAPAVGTAATLNVIPITAAGTYTITVAQGGVSGPALGNYVVQATLNAVPEAESNGGATNDTTGTAQNLGPTFLSPGGGLSSVTVQGESDVVGIVNEVEPNGTTATATPADTYSSVPNNGLYQLGISGNLSSSTDADYFNIGPMQVGDVLTISESGNNSGGRGTLNDSLVQLYRAGTSTVVTSDDDSGPGTGSGGHDSLIYQFTITVADTYYVRASRFSSSVNGTYQLGIVLQNSGTAPATGGTFTTETEPNDSVAAANNASGSWRPVNYFATASGAVAASDTDIYSYQFSAGDLISFVTQSTSTLAPTAALLNSAGTTIASDNGTSTVAVAGGFAPLYSYVIPTTGTYYLSVGGSSSTTGSYTAGVMLSTSASLSTVPPGKDLYSFTLTAGQSASAVINSSTAGGVSLSLLDSNGNPVATGVAGSTNVDAAINGYLAPTAGTYYLQIGGPANITYQVTLVTGGTFDAEPNDSFATAQSLVAGTAALGAISGSDDWYQFNVTAGNVVTLTTTTPGAGPGEFTNTLDPAIELYDPSGNLVGSDDNSAADGRNASLTRTAAATGAYRVRVRPANATSGEYTLNTAVAAGPPATVSSIVVGDGTVQRSEVRSITVTFSDAVTFAGGNANAKAAFQLHHVKTNTDVDLTASLTADGSGHTIVTLTFSGTEVDRISSQGSANAVPGPSLADGRYTLTINGAMITGSNNVAVDAAGNGTAGSVYTSPTEGVGSTGLHLWRLYGDATGDGVNDPTDLNTFRLAFNTNNQNPGSGYLAYLDANNDGAVDPTDLNQYRMRFNTNVF